jgi:hypothetical protein
VLLKPYDDYINGYTDEKGKKHIGFAHPFIPLECVKV